MRVIAPGGLPRPELVLGEEGRGRTCARIPVLLEGDDPAERVSVEITDHGVRIVPEVRRDDEHVLIVLRGDPGYSRGAEYRYGCPEGTRVLAAGWGAYGAAGRVGGWEELLVMCPAEGEIEMPGKYRTRWLVWDRSGWRIESETERAARLARGAAAKAVY